MTGSLLKKTFISITLFQGDVAKEQFMNKFLLLLSLFFSLKLMSATSFEESCKDLNICMQKVSALTGMKYYSSEKLKGVVTSSKNLNLNQENADQLFSSILFDHGYTRIKEGQDTYKIVSARDIRYSATATVESHFDLAPNLPRNLDYYMLNYKLRSQKNQIATEVVSSLRPFLSRYGRIIHMNDSGMIMIQDTAQNLMRFYEIIKAIDIVPSAEQLKQFEMERERRFELAKIESQNCQSLKKQLEAMGNSPLSKEEKDPTQK